METTVDEIIPVECCLSNVKGRRKKINKERQTETKKERKKESKKKYLTSKKQGRIHGTRCA